MQVAETWGQRMDPEFYQSVDKRERDRQEAINEIIYGEEQYLKDLELLREVRSIPICHDDSTFFIDEATTMQ